MEFGFRAGDDRSGNPPPSTDDAAASAEARIRERLLREDEEKLAELEAEVRLRRELMEKRIPLLRSGQGLSAGAFSLGSVATPAPSGTQTRIELEARSKANASVAFSVKRKNSDVAVASTASISTRSNKQKLELSCKVCSIALTSEKALQDHLKGKAHMRKAARLAQPTTEVRHEDHVEAMQVQSNALAVLPDKQKTPSIATVTSSKTQKPDLTCKVCGITSTSQKAMQDHLEGRNHKKKVATHPQLMPEEKVPSKANVPADAPILSAAASGKKQKLDLTCTVCDIPLTSEKAMEDHLKGKAHRKKAAAVVPEEAEHEQEEKEEEGSYTPNKFNLMTNDGTICEVMQMDGSVFCEVCNVSAPDRVTMLCHLQGTKHTSKAKQKAATPPATATIAAAVVDGDPQTVVMTINSVPHTVRRVGDSLLCELCYVKVPSASEPVMRSHLSGKMHTNKLKAVASVDMGAAGKAEIITKDTVALATNVHITAETPVQEVKKDDGADTIGSSELVEAKSKEASLAARTVSCTQGNACMEKPAVEACVPASIAPDATVGCPTATVVEKKADTEGNTSRIEEMEAVETDGIAVVPAGQEVKMQVEGKLFSVLRQTDGRLSCRLCDVHGCEKYDMIKHLYAHLDKVPLAQ
ncbi:unnamed protein product [Alopecurus aequalis]